MITADQAIRWLWDQYKVAKTMADLEFWYDRFADALFRESEIEDMRDCLKTAVGAA